MTAEEARENQPEGLVTVTGYYIVAEADVVRLCSLIMESYPPQCGGESLELQGVDLDDYETESDGGVTWTPGYVDVRGELEDELLRVDNGGDES